MESVLEPSIFSLLLHLDQHLQSLFTHFGAYSYAILFLIVFCETGLVVTPFLPGDSLLFLTGTFVAGGYLNVFILIPLLFVAAVLGDALNYYLGKRFGEKVFAEDSGILKKIFKKKYLHQTQEFYEKYGNSTIILARFVPIIRTFAPFVAGIGAMKYQRFFLYNVVGGVVWVAGLILLGMFFGNLPWVKENLTLVTMGIIILSILPGLVQMVKNYRLA